MKSKVSIRGQSNGQLKNSAKLRMQVPPKKRKPTLWQREQKLFHQKMLSGGEAKTGKHYADAIIQAAPSLLVLDENLRVKTANQSFFKSFGISSSEAIDLPVFALGNGDWNIPKLRTLLKEVLPSKHAFKNFEITHKFKYLGTRTLVLSGRHIENLQRILLFIDDITERRQAQAAIGVSELRYRRLFEAARDGILVIDPLTRKITDANPFMSELLGYPPKELIGKELWEIGLLRDEKASQAAFRELRTKHFIRYEDLPLQNKSGQRREVEFVSNLYEEDGRQVIQCNIRDITGRKEVEHALKASEVRYRNLFNTIDEGFCIVELIFDQKRNPVDYRFLEVNPSFEKQSGLQNATGKRILELAPGHETSWFKIFGKVALTGTPVRFTQEARALNRWFDVYGFPLSETDHRRVAILFTDITARKAAEDALLIARNAIDANALELERLVKERTAELRETIGDLEGFSYSVSHDMRAPLRAMQSYASYLVEEYANKLDETGNDYLQKIMRSSVRLDRLIQDVLSYTRLLHAKVPMGVVDLDRLVRDLVDVLPNGQPIKPEIKVIGSLPSVIGNEALLAQCVSNLLANGVKFISPGTVPRIEVSARAHGEAATRVSFKDNGIGIAAENHDRIFRLFERIYPATEYEGTGIGLTIVRKAADRMDAEIGFESQLGKGSNFWIQLKKA